MNHTDQIDDVLKQLQKPSTKPYPGEKMKRRNKARQKLQAVVDGAVVEAKMQAAVDIITQFKNDRIQHILGTPFSEWDRELETADKTLAAFMAALTATGEAGE